MGAQKMYDTKGGMRHPIGVIHDFILTDQFIFTNGIILGFLDFLLHLVVGVTNGISLIVVGLANLTVSPIGSYVIGQSFLSPPHNCLWGTASLITFTMV